tara:strand:- start:46 stop:333 length:288 start_codon:yes stop_codon:yes gene_type:complete
MAEETRVKEIENVQGDLSKKLDTVLEEIKSMSEKPKPEQISQRSMTEKQAAEEFIEHFDSCDDGNCGIHNMKDDTKKQGFMKGFMLGKKLQEKKE